MPTLEKDSMFTLSFGVYSNFEVVTICKAIVDIDTDALRAEYLKTHPEQAEPHPRVKDSHVIWQFKEYEFVKWLIVDKKVCQELDYFEWYLGEYHDACFGVYPGKKEVTAP